ncbi:MAG: hypothetical protein ACOY0T_40285 [Myxococcota bacterium]
MARELAPDGVRATALVCKGARLIPHRVLLGIAQRIDVREGAEGDCVALTILVETGTGIPFRHQSLAEAVERRSFVGLFGGRAPGAPNCAF